MGYRYQRGGNLPTPHEVYTNPQVSDTKVDFPSFDMEQHLGYSLEIWALHKTNAILFHLTTPKNRVCGRMTMPAPWMWGYRLVTCAGAHCPWLERSGVSCPYWEDETLNSNGLSYVGVSSECVTCLGHIIARNARNTRDGSILSFDRTSTDPAFNLFYWQIQETSSGGYQLKSISYCRFKYLAWIPLWLQYCCIINLNICRRGKKLQV